MSIRDSSDLALRSLASFLSDETGIPTGRISLQYSNDDYVNERTAQTLPAIGICEVGKSRIVYNNYGCTKKTDNEDGTWTAYTPLGEKNLMVRVDVWCKTQAERRTYKNIIETSFLENKFLSTELADDLVTGEYMRLEFLDYELSEDKPFIAFFFLDINIPIFKQQTVYLADTISLNAVIGQELDIPTDGDWSASGTPWIVITSGGITVTGEIGSEFS